METISNILIVDDDTDICDLMERIMGSEHLVSKSLNSLTGVFEILSNYHPSVMFLDNQLPDGLGIEQIPLIKKNFPSLKVVLITADTRQGLQELAERNGADLLISKPFTISSIKAALKRFVPVDSMSHAA